MNLPRQLCTFYLDGLYWGIEVTRVQEVIRYQEMTRVPLAPPHVRGLINLRGQIVTAIEMRTRLGLSPRQENNLPMNVVVRSDDGGISLLVDEIGDVVEVSDATFEPAPATVQVSSRELLRGVYKLDKKLLLQLDADRLLEPSRGVGS
ncbi:MAG: chemotaxis protein CheW [Polyangiaceae bacterium]